MPSLERDELLPAVPLDRISDLSATGVTYKGTRPKTDLRFDAVSVVEVSRTATHVRLYVVGPIVWSRI